MTTDINAIYLRHMDALQLISDTHKHIHSSAMGLSLRLALAELDAAWRELAAAQPAADIVEEHRHLDGIVRRIERVLEAHDSAVYADLVAGNYELPTAIDAVIDSYKSALAAVGVDTQRYNAFRNQLQRINAWLYNEAGDTCTPEQYDGDTADAMIAVADTLRGQVAKLRTELAAAIAERDESDSLLAKLADWLDTHPVDDGDGNEVDTAIKLLEFQAAELDTLRQQLAQMDADNARLTQELRTVRSWSVAPTGNGKSHPAAILPSAQSADETPAWNDAMLTGLDDATADYWHGIAAGRWTWRKLPKSVRLAMVRHVLSFGPEARAMSMSEFDASKPHWMPGAGSHPVTFGVPWSTLSDLRVEIEVPA